MIHLASPRSRRAVKICYVFGCWLILKSGRTDVQIVHVVITTVVGHVDQKRGGGEAEKFLNSQARFESI